MASSAQRYSDPLALRRMANGRCPECGLTPESHSEDSRFWLRAADACSLRESGVNDRIEQAHRDNAEAAAKRG